MSLPPPPDSPPLLRRRSATYDMNRNPNENNDFVYSNWSSNSNSSERNSLSNRKTIKKRPLAKAKLKSSKKKKPNNRTTRRRPLAKPPRKLGLVLSGFMDDGVKAPVLFDHAAGF